MKWPIWDPWRPHVERLVVCADESGLSEPTTRLMNDLGTYLHAKAMHCEAEPLSRRHLEIFLLFTMRTGHEHPHLNAALENYRRLLAEMGHDENEQQDMIQLLMEAVQNRFHS